VKFERQLAWPCVDCTVRDLSFCATLASRPSSDLPTSRLQTSQVFMTADKDEVVGHSGIALPSGPFVLCKGWAFRFHLFPDGRRQILSLLIPGDLFSAFAISSQPGFRIQAATDIQYCEFGRDDIRRRISESATACDMFGKFCAQEADEATAALIYLNHGNATDRVTHFMRRLVNRLAARDMQIGDDVYPFPLTHADIADAVGLSTAEVNRAIQNLSDERVIDLSNGELTIINAIAFDSNRSASTHHDSLYDPGDSTVRLL
jgi:CRP/FNR family transcriptional regulator, anaerobic regulatory protein